MSPSTLPAHDDRRRAGLGASAVRASALAAAAALILAGCSNGEDFAQEATDAATSSAVTVTVTNTVETTTPSSAAQASSSTATVTTTAAAPCDPETFPVAENAAAIAPPMAGVSWVVERTGNLCGTLGFAALSTAGGTGSSPTQLLLYNEGKYLGTGIKCGALGQVLGSTDDSVSVGYRWPRGNDSNANMTGRANVMFQWNGSSVDMIGELPAEAMPTSC